MQVERELRTGVAVLLVFQLVTSLSAIALLTRMTPAISEILAENEYTIEACEEMLAAIAATAPKDDRRRLFDAALARAAKNVTEQSEPRLLEILEAQSAKALAEPPDQDARSAVIGAIQELARTNRESMNRAGESARALGATGAWTSVFLGLLAFAFSFVIARRLDRRIVDPMAEIDDVVSAARHGDVYRRCVPSGPKELQSIATAINALLDDQQWTEHDPNLAKKDRSALLHFLDKEQSPSIVVTKNGTVIATNKSGLAWVEDRSIEDVRSILESASRGEVRVVTIQDDALFLVQI